MGNDDYELIVDPLNCLRQSLTEEFSDILIEELWTDDVFLNTLIYPNRDTKSAVGCLASRAVLIGNTSAAVRIIRTYLNKQPDQKFLPSMRFETIMGLCNYRNTEDMKRFEVDVYPAVAAHPIWSSPGNLHSK